MSINDLPVLSALRTKMQWHQERQRVLAENISNSDTPNFKPRDLVEPKFDKQRRQRRRRHGNAADAADQRRPCQQPRGRRTSFDNERGKSGFQTRPAGNAVNLEDQMLKVSANQMDYAAATSLYSRSLRAAENRDRQSADAWTLGTTDHGR